jgi:ubiquinone biosynthesis monooxygenase Coq7
MTDSKIGSEGSGQLPLPGRKAGGDRIDEIIRVDHAGELGAVRIYEGQLAVLRRTGSQRVVAQIEEMAAQEERHLEEFNRLIADRGVRPTALQPIWNVAGFALGAATALLGEKAAMACTVAVEEVIDDHYAAQSDELARRDEPLKETIDDFRVDELAHRDMALAEGAEQATGYPLLTDVIKAGCRIAIRLSEKI